MGELINLRKIRKQKARADKMRKAEENRTKFGRTKSEKRMSVAKKAKLERKLDAHKRES